MLLLNFGDRSTVVRLNDQLRVHSALKQMLCGMTADKLDALLEELK